ncbi:hypothetical protein, partial [Immundisolibacter sp.]|uniref:hypothetical protein n=1 Tax=Immundisolibacter sp. TaxID=1934948 RepID=UPI00356347AA
SDGIVSFVCLGDEVVKCKMNGVFGVLGLAGTLCLAGLATGRPVRGAIEIAWGVELQPGELYGPAVACAYELENAVAQYPRIVVGPETMRYLKRHANNPDQSVFASVDREFAALCLSMLARDEDGHWIVHYLGDKFQSAITHEHHLELYSAAAKFVGEQVALYQSDKNSKLAFRYSHLSRYFQAHQPEE